MVFNRKKKLALFWVGGFSLLAGLVMIITATIGGTALRASAENYHTANHYARRVHDSALFTTTGVNRTVAQALIDAVNNTAKGTNGARTAKNFSDFASNGVAQVNGALYVRLFDTLGDIGQVNGTETTPLNAFTNSITNTGANFVGGGARWWRVVYERDGILTLYMAEPYRNSRFNQSYTDGNVYANSLVRTNLTNDFNSILNRFPHANDYIALGGQSWQNGIANSADWWGDVYTHPSPTNEKIWLPSHYETTALPGGPQGSWISSGNLNNTNRTGLWEMNGFDRGWQWSGSGFSGFAWLRSGRTDRSDLAGYVDGYGYAGSGGVDGAGGVRPSLHITLSNLNTYTVANPPQSGTGWVLLN